MVGNTNPAQNPNLNPNQNIQMISIEPREINIVPLTRGGVVTGANQDTQHGKLQVGSMAQNKVPFDVQKEMEVFLDVRPKFVEKNQASISGSLVLSC